MTVTRKDVRYMANLARLRLTPEEEKNLATDMNRILEYMQLLNQVDTSGVPPLEHVTETLSEFRSDRAEAPLDHEAALQNAPDADADYFRVPKVIE